MIMLPETQKILETTLVEQQSDSNKEFVDKIEKFLLNQETQYFFLRNEQDFNRLIQLLGHNLFDYSKIRSYSYESHSAEMLSEQNTTASFKGEGSIHAVLAHIGDIGTNLEFCNDFQIYVLVDLDAETSVFYQYESSEDANVCADCADLEEYDQVSGYNRFYSCEHEQSTFSSRYYAVLRSRIADEEVDRALGFGEV